jgi:hypothetical protein
MLNNQFWMFGVLLMIITVISAFGGGIRYRENFLEEVFDLNDITNELEQSNNYYPINFRVPEEEEIVEEEKIDNLIAPNRPVLEEPSRQVVRPSSQVVQNPTPTKQVVQNPTPIKPNVYEPIKPQGVPTFKQPFETIEAYSGGLFATF